VGFDVIAAIRDLFRTGKLLKKINNTFIVLVPKKPNPMRLANFRPISLCTTIYKLCTKLLVLRFQPFLDKIISPSHKGFVPGRQILDAIITTHETIHSMAKSRILGMVLKLDISKAYDRVSW